MSGGEALKTSYLYDKMGRRTDVIQPARIDPLLEGHPSPITTTIYDALGRVKEIHAPGSNDTADQTAITTYEYDGLGRVSEVTGPAGQAGRLTTRYTYDLRDNVTQVDLRTASVSLDMATTNIYDARDRLVAVDYPDSGSGTAGMVTLYAYDAAGQMLRQLDYAGNVSAYQLITNGAGPADYQVDDLAQSMLSFGWTARLSIYVYDDLGRVIQSTAPDPDGTGPVLAPFNNYVYDARGNQLSQSVIYVDATGAHVLKTQTEYDNLNQPYHTLGPATPGASLAATPESYVA